jgi:hypothetical protein
MIPKENIGLLGLVEIESGFQGLIAAHKLLDRWYIHVSLLARKPRKHMVALYHNLTIHKRLSFFFFFFFFKQLI